MARQVLEHHPEWAGHAVGFLRDLLEKPEQSREDKAAFAELVLPFLANDQVQELVATAIRNDGDKFPADRRVQVLETNQPFDDCRHSSAWVDAIAQVVDQAPPEVRLAAVRCAAVLQIGELDDQIGPTGELPGRASRAATRSIAGDRSQANDTSAGTFDLLMNDLASDADPLVALSRGGNVRQDAARSRAAASPT